MRALIFFCLCSGFLGTAVGQQHVDTSAAYYPGGPGAWARHLNKYLRMPVDVNFGYSSATLAFDVSAQGNISHISMVSGDTSMRATFFNLLVKSAPWVPAKLNNKSIASHTTTYIRYCLRGE